MGKEVVFGADATCQAGDLRGAGGAGCEVRHPPSGHEGLGRDIAGLLTRPVGRQSYKPVVWSKGFRYRAASWKTTRWVVANVEFHFGELFLRRQIHRHKPGNGRPGVVRLDNQRGTAEQWIKERKQGVKMTGQSCHRSRSNEVRLCLCVTAYNLGNLWRLVLERSIHSWSLTSLQQRLVKTGGRLVEHPRYYWLRLAESHLTRRLCVGMLGRIEGLPVPTGAPVGQQENRSRPRDGWCPRTLIEQTTIECVQDSRWGVKSRSAHPGEEKCAGGLGRRQKGVCSQVRGGNASSELRGILRSWVNVYKDTGEMPASSRRADYEVQEKAECAEPEISLHPKVNWECSRWGWGPWPLRSWPV